MILRALVPQRTLGLGLSLAALLAAAGCGDKVNVKEAGLPETDGVVSEKRDLKLQPFGNDDITITRVRVLKQSTQSPGVAPGGGNGDNVSKNLKYEDHYTVQVFAEMKDKTPVSWQMENLSKDAAGNLYLISNRPGTVYTHNLGTDFMTGSAGGNGPAGAVTFPGEAIPTYTVTAENAFITKNFNAWFVRQDKVSNAATAANPATTRYELVDLAAVAPNTPWKNFRKIALANNAMAISYEYWQKQDGNVKGTMGCMAKPVNAAGATLNKVFTFGDVHLGNVILNKDGQPATGAESTSDDGRADGNALWVKWTYTWQITGINLDKHSLNILQTRQAPYWRARELPTVDLTSTAAAPNAAEAFIKACNASVKADNAASAAASTFAFFNTESVSDIAATPAGARSAGYDKALEDNTNGQNNTAFATVFTAGAWNGTAHTGPVAVPAADASLNNYVEMSDVKTVTF